MGVVQDNRDNKKKLMLECLTRSKGIVTDACLSAGIYRSTHYRWIDEDPEYKAAVEDVQEIALDFVEGKLFEKVNGVRVQTGTDKEGEPIIYDQPPSDTAIIFYLKTKGKKRGYVERQEIEQTVAGKLKINIVPLEGCEDIKD